MLIPLSLKDSREWYSNHQELRVISPQGVYARLGDDGILAFGRETPIVYSVLNKSDRIWKNILESMGITSLGEILQDSRSIQPSNRTLANRLVRSLRTPRRITESAGERLFTELSQREQYAPVGIDDISDEYINQQLELNSLPKKGRLEDFQELAFLAYNSQKRQAGGALRDFHQNPSDETRRRIQTHLDEAGKYLGLIFQGNTRLAEYQVNHFSGRLPNDPDLFHDCAFLALHDAINGFNVSEGQSFSNYYSIIAWRRFKAEVNSRDRMPQGSMGRPLSLDDEVNLPNVIHSEEKDPYQIIVDEELEELGARVLDPSSEVLNEVECLVLNSRSKGLTHKEAGKIIGLTRERARQIYFEGLRRAREHIEQVTS